MDSPVGAVCRGQPWQGNGSARRLRLRFPWLWLVATLANFRAGVGPAAASPAAPAAPAAKAGRAAGVQGQVDLRWHSQYGQDRLIYERYFAAAEGEEGLRQGVFIELGAADGIDKSNTLAFERRLGWRGILIEPSRPLFEELRQNRPGSTCVHACVARAAGDYVFMEDGLSSGFVSHVRGSGADDESSEVRHCQTLPEIIDEHLGRTAHIDYLSLDLEGGELDVLRSMDFTRHRVDIMTIEVDEWRGPERARLISELLHQRGYRFVERLVLDDIWIRRRVSMTDPGCYHPGLRVAASSRPVVLPEGGWEQMRTVMWRLLARLQTLWEPEQGLPEGAVADTDPDLLYIIEAVGTLQGQDAAGWQSECPAAALTLAMVGALLHCRHQAKPMDAAGVTNELRKQTVFLTTMQIRRLGKNIGGEFDKFVEESEKKAEEFGGIRLPLGRNWHEIAFVDTLESAWPLFGYLDLASRLIASGGYFFDTVYMNGRDYKFPHRVPRILCELSIGEGSSRASLRLMDRYRRGRGSRISSVDLGLDADACSMLGVAASQFHAARWEAWRIFRHNATTGTGARLTTRFVGLANWTAGPCAAVQAATPSRAACEASSLEKCAALEGGWRPVARGCLAALRPALGASLQLRRGPRLQGLEVDDDVAHGERLVREFVRRHGFHAAIWSMAQPELLLPPFPLAGTSESYPHAPAPAAAALVDGGGSAGVTAFAELHALQESMLRTEGFAY